MTPAQRRALEGALAHAGTHDLADVEQGIAEGYYQFWPCGDSAVVTEVLDTPKKRILNFFLAGGSLAELEAALPIILEWGKTQGCTSASLIGRKGWERTFLTRHGWQVTHSVMEVELVDLG